MQRSTRQRRVSLNAARAAQRSTHATRTTRFKPVSSRHQAVIKPSSSRLQAASKPSPNRLPTGCGPAAGSPSCPPGCSAGCSARLFPPRVPLCGACPLFPGCSLSLPSTPTVIFRGDNSFHSIARVSFVDFCVFFVFYSEAIGAGGCLRSSNAG